MNPVDVCPLCSRIAAEGLLAENALAAAFLDAFPVSPGHVLIVSRRHVANLFDLTIEEQQALWSLLPLVKASIDTEYNATAYNVGVNVGADAGQTVGHVHVHVIPRYPGDVADPRGGIRWVIPDRAAYWDRDK